MEEAKQYEELKLSLWKKYECDRDGYTSAKATFIALHTETDMRTFLVYRADVGRLYRDKVYFPYHSPF